MTTDRDPLPCGRKPDPARIALRRMADAESRYVAGMQAAGDDPALTAVAEATFAAELDAIDATITAHADPDDRDLVEVRP